MSHFANCSGFSDNQLTILTALRGGTSAAACISTTVLLIVTLCAFQSKLGVGRQDRCLKIGLFALFGVSISYLTMLSLSVVYHLLPASSAGKWCEAFGFFDQMLSVIQITVLFTNTYPIVECLWSEITRGHEQTVCCKKQWVVWGLMGTVIGLASVILISSFVPFITETYGEVCVWCWILTIDKNCKVILAGFLEQLFLWIIYQAFISLMCILMILASVIIFLKAVYKIRNSEYQNLGDGHDYKHVFFKYVFQLIILIPIFVDYADVVIKPHIHDYSFILWVYYAVAPPISGFLIPFSFLLYIKFGNAGSRNNPQCLSNAQGASNRRDIRSTADEQRSPFMNVIAFTSSDVYMTAVENHGQTDVHGANKHSTEPAEGQFLLEGRLDT